MLKLRTKGGRILGRSEIEFSPYSKHILEVRHDKEGIMQDSHHDRAMELGARCGDLLSANYMPGEARSIVEELTRDIQPPERAEVFRQAAHTIIEQSVDVSGQEIAA